MKFKVIYCDPPWAYHVYSKKGKGRSAENHYRTMQPEEIYALDIAGIADRDCALFLWVTFPCILQGLEAVRRWGFTYKTLGFCWVKRCQKQTDKWFWGLGFWTRANPELCLLATKGRPQRMEKGVHSLIDTPVERHSKKPEEARRRIERLMGDVSRVELFARERHDGWFCAGDGVDGMDIRESIERLKRMGEPNGMEGGYSTFRSQSSACFCSRSDL